MKWITGLFEIILAIPILGAAIVVFSGYSVLGFMFIFHLITLILSSKNNESIYGSVLGIVTSFIGLDSNSGMGITLDYRDSVDGKWRAEDSLSIQPYISTMM